MNITNAQSIRVTAVLLLALAVTQALYTALYVGGADVPRQLLWGLEALLFTVLAAFAGAAMVQARDGLVGWAAIVVSAVFNLVQVSIGVTQFGPFFEAAGDLEALGGLAGSVLALSFMIYYAAKLLLGLAALVFGLARMQDGARVLGGVTAAVGVVAIVANGISILFGRDVVLPSAAAGGSGVLATVLLGICLFRLGAGDGAAEAD